MKAVAFLLGGAIGVFLITYLATGDSGSKTFSNQYSTDPDSHCVKIDPVVMRCKDMHSVCYIYWNGGISCVKR